MVPVYEKWKRRIFTGGTGAKAVPYYLNVALDPVLGRCWHRQLPGKALAYASPCFKFLSYLPPVFVFASPFFPKFSVFVLKIDVVNNNKVCTGTFYNKVCTMYNVPVLVRHYRSWLYYCCAWKLPWQFHVRTGDTVKKGAIFFYKTRSNEKVKILIPFLISYLSFLSVGAKFHCFIYLLCD